MFRMTMRAGREARNAGSFLRKELGEALRIGLKDSGMTANRRPSRRLVFSNSYDTNGFYRDPSLSLRMTVGGGKGIP